MLKFPRLMNLFKFLCVITTSCTVGYWIHKYGKNEDLTTIEYISLDEADDLILPELNLCLINPFLDNDLKNISKALSTETYLKYLRGEISSNEKLNQINYDQVTLNLFEHLNKVVVFLRPGQNPPKYSCSNPQNCPYINLKSNFSGFVGPMFYKCFGIETNRKYSKDVSAIVMDFKTTLPQKLRPISDVRSGINYPHQHYRGMSSDHSLWTNRYDTKSFSTFKIYSIEILRHRNKPNHECFSDWMYYDDLILRDHLKKVGCRAPYQNFFKHLPVCDTKEKMEQSNFNLHMLHKLPVPCQEMSQLAFKFSDGFQQNGYDSFPLLIQFPDKIRAITQSQAIDIHSLIGNIGGYIGLFLGKLVKHNYFNGLTMILYEN